MFAAVEKLENSIPVTASRLWSVGDDRIPTNSTGAATSDGIMQHVVRRACASCELGVPRRARVYCLLGNPGR